MSFYFNVSKTASTIQSKIISVCCEKCGCAYCYEMTRIGTGINVAHYGIAWHSPGATAERQEQSEARGAAAAGRSGGPASWCAGARSPG